MRAGGCGRCWDAMPSQNLLHWQQPAPAARSFMCDRPYSNWNRARKAQQVRGCQPQHMPALTARPCPCTAPARACCGCWLQTGPPAPCQTCGAEFGRDGWAIQQERVCVGRLATLAVGAAASMAHAGACSEMPLSPVLRLPARAGQPGTAAHPDTSMVVFFSTLTCREGVGRFTRDVRAAPCDELGRQHHKARNCHAPCRPLHPKQLPTPAAAAQLTARPWGTGISMGCE